MYNHFQLLLKYIRYYLTASNGKGHGMHSPFVFHFIYYVLQNQLHYLPPATIEAARQQLLKDASVIEVNDLGAGSRVSRTSQKRIKDIAKAAVKPQKYGQLLYRLVRYYDPKTIIELGTSLGITTTYLAAANPTATVITIEGSKAIAEVAQKNFKVLHLQNITALSGNFDAVLPQVLQDINRVDLAFVDGNHRYIPTLHYFQQLLQKKGNDTILVFDDIHWSVEMEKAWNEIQQHPSVQYTVDLFFLGFVFFKKEFKEKQHFVIRY